jgi:multidrug efflux pump subunit AcrB
MKNVIQYFIKYPIAANLLMFTLLVGGIFGASMMKSTFFPEAEDKLINIQAILPGASPEEVEEGIVLKIEEKLKGLEGVEKITSSSQENAGSVTVQVLKGYDANDVIQDVKNAVDAINSFPSGMEPATIYVAESTDFAISYGISGDVDLKTLKIEARRIEDELREQAEVSNLVVSGFPDEEIEIAFKEDALIKYQMTFQEAAFAVQKSNLITTGGTIKGAKEELLIRAENKKYSASELEDIVIRATGGSVIRLGDVAIIRDKWSDNPNREYINSEKAVVINIFHTKAEDILTICGNVNDYFEEYNAKEGNPIRATKLRDSSIALNQRIGLLIKNGLSGFFIVLVLLAMFLNWRLAFWVALSIPVSFAGMFIFAPLLGESINIISLFGMILVIGILVDDGIVISENIYQLHEKGMDSEEAAIKGTMSVLPAVTAAIITTIIAFSSFYFLDGAIGEFFSSMATIVILSLTFSLVEGALILPGHVAHSKAMQAGAKKNIVLRTLDGFLFFIRDKMYAPLLKLVTLNFLTALCVPIVLAGGLYLAQGAFASGKVQGTFFPQIPLDAVNATLKMPAGTPTTITEAQLAKVEAAVWKVNEKIKKEKYNGELDYVVSVSKTVGPTTYDGRLTINLADAMKRGDTVTERDLSTMIKETMEPLEGEEYFSMQNISPFGLPVSIALLGANKKELNTALSEFKSRLKAMPELKDVVDDNQEGLREVNIELNDKARFLGLNLNDVVGQVRQGFFGYEVQRLQKGRDEVKVWVRYEDSDRSNLSKLENMRVRFANGNEYTLSDIANFKMERGVVNIRHLNGKRVVNISADVANDDVSVSGVNAEVNDVILPSILAKYTSVSLNFGGQKEEQLKLQASVSTVMPVIFFMMFLCIAVVFRSVSQSAMVFLLIPFAFIGVVGGHWLMGKPVSILSGLGVIALIGILVNDALVYISTYNDFIREGKSQWQSTYDASISRFRPIVLTSITTVAGLFPLLFEKSTQAQFLIPMAISVAFGLMLITVIILLLLPAFIIIFNRIKWSIAWGLTVMVGEKSPTYLSVEPHYQGKRHWIFGLFSALLAVSVLVMIFRMKFG